MRPRRLLGMILNREDGQTAVTEALQRPVVEIDMSRLQVARQIVLLDREAVVLRGDLDFLSALIEHRLVRAPVAEFQFERLAAPRLTQNLMTQADAEDRRQRLSHELAHGPV